MTAFDYGDGSKIVPTVNDLTLGHRPLSLRPVPQYHINGGMGEFGTTFKIKCYCATLHGLAGRPLELLSIYEDLSSRKTTTTRDRY